MYPSPINYYLSPGSYSINAAAEAVLGKVAKVVNDHKEIDIPVEGHTDNVSISTDQIKDNWDLSVLRANNPYVTEKIYGGPCPYDSRRTQ